MNFVVEGGEIMVGDIGERLKRETNVQKEFWKLQMKAHENSFIIEQRYNDLSNKLDALCIHLGLKIEKQEGYTVVNRR